MYSEVLLITPSHLLTDHACPAAEKILPGLQTTQVLKAFSSNVTDKLTLV